MASYQDFRLDQLSGEQDASIRTLPVRKAHLVGRLNGKEHTISFDLQITS